MNNGVAQMVQGFVDQLSGNQHGALSQWAIRSDGIGQTLEVAADIRKIGAGSSNKIPMGSRRGERMQAGSCATRLGNVGIIPIIGPLVSRESVRNWSYDEIVREAGMMAGMDDIDAVIFDINSPGGLVVDVEVAAEAIRALSVKKPTACHISGIGASAAYWLAAATGHITASQGSIIGSVGSLISWVDMEGVFTKLGARKIEVVAKQSPNKRLDPDSAEGQQELQAIVDEAGEMFLQTLSSHREVSREQILENYGQGLVFPAAKALELGMIDQIVSLEELIAQMAARGSTFEPAASATAPVVLEEKTMTDKTKGGTAAKGLTVESLSSDHPDLVAQIQSAAVTGATDDIVQNAAQAERERILGIEAVALPGHEDLIAEMKADGKTTKGDAAIRVNAAEKTASKNRIDGLNQLDAAASGIVSTPSSEGASGVETKATTPEGWKAEWDASAELQEKHLSAAAYVSVMSRQ